MEAHSICRKLWHFEPARLNPIKVAYNSISAGWPAQLSASAFNRLSQYVSSPGDRTYCYAELDVSSLAAVLIAPTQ